MEKRLQQKKFFEDSIKKFPKNYDFKNKIAGIMLEAFQGWEPFFIQKII